MAIRSGAATIPRGGNTSRQVLLGAAAFWSGGSAPGAREGISQKVVLTHKNDFAYYGQILVGTQGQAVDVVFDTGSSELWVATPSSSLGKPSYKVEASSTHTPLEEPFEINYGSGQVKGKRCNDTLRIGELRLANFTFAVAHDTTGLRAWEFMAFSGILGLGPPGLKKSPGPSVMEALLASGQLEQPVFGFYLPSGAPGQLVLGGVDPDHIAGSFTWLKVKGQGHWAVPLDGVRLGRHAIAVSAPLAVVDSGTSLLLGPTQEVTSMVKLLGAQEQKDGTYYVQCSRALPTLSLSMGGRDFSFSGAELIVNRTGDRCDLGIQVLVVVPPIWILGDVFMRKYYTQFDYRNRRIGFALAKPAGPRRLDAHTSDEVLI